MCTDARIALQGLLASSLCGVKALAQRAGGDGISEWHSAAKGERHEAINWRIQ
jgi:hypothetical protein